MFVATGPGGGGATYSPSISPHDPEHIFVACDMAGMYRTADAGHSWSTYPFGQLSSTIKNQMQFTGDPNILYALHRPLAYETIFRAIPKKSTDGGNSWQNMTDPTATGVHRLFADPGSTQRILLNEYDRLFFSNNGGTSFNEVHNPGGLVWLGGVFWDGNHIYVGTAQGLLVSHDGGAMLVEFESDYAITFEGWAANYEACLADRTVSGNPIAPGVYQAANSIVSSGLVAGAVEFQAGMEVRLEAGFEVQAGAVFQANTGAGCQ